MKSYHSMAIVMRTLEIFYPKKLYREINEFWEYDFGDFEMKSY